MSKKKSTKEILKVIITVTATPTHLEIAPYRAVPVVKGVRIKVNFAAIVDLKLDIASRLASSAKIRKN